METQEFNCYIPNTLKIKQILIPTKCPECNFTLKVLRGSSGVADCFETVCVHFSNYMQVYERQIKNCTGPAVCSKCKTKNDYLTDVELGWVCTGCVLESSMWE